VVDNLRFESQHGKEFFFLFYKTTRPALGPTQPHIQWLPEFFVEVKLLSREPDHSLTASGVVENKWSYTSTLLTLLHGVDRESYPLSTYIYIYIYMHTYIRMTVLALRRGF
jgi:hypothetical protein